MIDADQTSLDQKLRQLHFEPFGSARGSACARCRPTNARRGLEYLARALELGDGRVDLALAGYNGALSRIPQPPDTWPAETQRYVAWGSGIYADVTAGRSNSPALQAWLEAGGARLCRAAAQPS